MYDVPKMPRDSIFIRRRLLILISLGLIYLVFLLYCTLRAIYGVNYSGSTGMRERWFAYPLQWYMLPGSAVWGGVLLLYLSNWFYRRPWLLKGTSIIFVLFIVTLMVTMPPEVPFQYLRL